MMSSMEDKLLTIAIPTYNGSKTIASMLNILLPQVDERVEVLISDNCSTDNTVEIVDGFAQKYPYIKFVQNYENKGADYNFLQCMKMANGKFTMLLSDDDILVENGLDKILSFLEQYDSVTLAFLYTISFKDNYIDVGSCDEFLEASKKPRKDLVTTSKEEFFSYVGRQWGFTSSFLWNTRRFNEIKNPEQYFGSYWLQSYIHILCSNKIEDLLGIIAGPCIAAGGYGIIPNYDAYKVEVLSFKKMLDYAVQEANYSEKQLTYFWLWKVCYILKRTVIKERAVGKRLTSVGKVYEKLKPYPYAWIHLFPYLLLPDVICKLILKLVRLKQKRNFGSYVNRET